MSDLFPPIDFKAGYAAAMRDAHRKLHQPICAPAITRHIVLRRDESDADEARWILRIELAIIALFRALQRQGGNPILSNLRQDSVDPPKDGIAFQLLRNRFRYDSILPAESDEPQQYAQGIADEDLDGGEVTWLGELSPEGTRYETVVMSAEWGNLPLAIRLEVFEEYFAITAAIELRQGGEHKLQTAIHQVASSMSGVDGDFGDSSRTLYHSQWRELNRLLISSLRLARGLSFKGSRDPKISEWIVDTFADFRGVILKLTPAGGVAGLSQRESDRLSMSKRSAYITRAFKTPEGRSAYAEKLLPLLIREDPAAGSPRAFESVEYSWSSFQNNSVLYGSCLGKSSTEGDSGYLTYVLLFDHDDYRSVGRIVG